MQNRGRDTPGSEKRKGNKERKKATRRLTFLDGDSYLDRTSNNGSDQMIPEDYFKGCLIELMRQSQAHKFILLICVRRLCSLTKREELDLKVSNGSQHCHWTPRIMSLLSTSLHLTYFQSILAITSHKVRTLTWVVCRWGGSLIVSMLPHGIRQLDTLTCSSSIWWQPPLFLSPNQIIA